MGGVRRMIVLMGVTRRIRGGWYRLEGEPRWNSKQEDPSVAV